MNQEVKCPKCGKKSFINVDYYNNIATSSDDKPVLIKGRINSIIKNCICQELDATCLEEYQKLPNIK